MARIEINTNGNIPDAIAGGAAGKMTGADKAKLDAISTEDYITLGANINLAQGTDYQNVLSRILPGASTSKWLVHGCISVIQVGGGTWGTLNPQRTYVRMLHNSTALTEHYMDFTFDQQMIIIPLRPFVAAGGDTVAIQINKSTTSTPMVAHTTATHIFAVRVG